METEAVADYGAYWGILVVASKESANKRRILQMILNGSMLETVGRLE